MRYMSFAGGKCPDGRWTENVETYISAWDELRKPLEALGFQVTSFDPALNLCDAQKGGGHFELPVYAAKRLLGIQ